MANQPRYSNALAALLDRHVPLHTPDDSAEWSFLGRAYHQIGECLHPDWTGKELTLTLPEVLPDAIDTRSGFFGGLGSDDDKSKQAEWYEPPRRATLEYALELLHLYRPDVRPKPTPGVFGSDFGLAPPRFTLYEWKIAQDVNRAHYQIVTEAFQRKRAVDKAIAALCEAGSLRTCLRSPEGGEFSEILPAAFWRTENYGERFKTWCMSREHPFSRLGPHEFIFVERTSLALVLRRLKAGVDADADSAAVGFISDQVSFLLRVAAKCGVTAEHSPSIESIKAQIVADWPWEGEPGVTELRYMASFIRNRAARDTMRKRAI